MPTYEYLCQTCSHRFEIWQKMADEPLNVCPECGSHIRRVFFPAGIVFKGSGFYKTDHGGSGSNGHSSDKTEAPTTEKTTPSATPSNESSSDTKSTTSGESKTTSAA